MRFFRFVAITVLLVACVVLGSACAGPKGEQGADGVGIESIVDNGDGTITFTLTDGSNYTSDIVTGPEGPQGATGAQGVQGIQGVKGDTGAPGPNMIVAMGFVDLDGNLSQGYNVTSATWDGTYYRITLTGITYNGQVTVVTPFFNTLAFHQYTAADGQLLVAMHDGNNFVKCGFSFMVLDTTH